MLPVKLVKIINLLIFPAIMYAVIIVVLAFYAEHLGSIFQAAITVVTTAVSIQGSVFLMGVFMAFVNKIVRNLLFQYE